MYIQQFSQIRLFLYLCVVRASQLRTKVQEKHRRTALPWFKTTMIVNSNLIRSLRRQFDYAQKVGLVTVSSSKTF